MAGAATAERLVEEGIRCNGVSPGMVLRLVGARKAAVVVSDGCLRHAVPG